MHGGGLDAWGMLGTGREGTWGPEVITMMCIYTTTRPGFLKCVFWRLLAFEFFFFFFFFFGGISGDF